MKTKNKINPIILLFITSTLSTLSCSIQNTKTTTTTKTYLQTNIYKLDTEFQNANKKQKINILKNIRNADSHKYIFIIIRAAFDKDKQIRKQALISFEHFRKFATENPSLSFYQHINKWLEEEPLIILKQMKLEKEYKNFIKYKENEGYRTLYYKKYPLDFLTDTKIFSIVSSNIINNDTRKNDKPDNKDSNAHSSADSSGDSDGKGSGDSDGKGSGDSDGKGSGDSDGKGSGDSDGKGSSGRKSTNNKNTNNNDTNEKIHPLTQFWTVWLIGNKKLKNKIPLLIALLTENKSKYKEIINAVALLSLSQLNYEYFNGLILKYIKNKNPYMQEIATTHFGIQKKEILIPTLINILKIQSASPQIKMGIIWATIKMNKEQKLLKWVLRTPYKNDYIFLKAYKLMLINKLNIETIPNIVISSIYQKNTYIKKLAFKIIEKENTNSYAKILYHIIKENKPSNIQIDTLTLLAKWKDINSIPHIVNLINNFSTTQPTHKNNKKQNKIKIQELKQNIITQAIKSISEIGYYNNILTQILNNQNFNSEQKNLSLNALIKAKYKNKKQQKTTYTLIKNFYLNLNTKNKNFPQFRKIIEKLADKKEINSILKNNLESQIASEAIYAIPQFKKNYENFDFIFNLMKNTKSEKIHIASIKTLGNLQYQKAFDLFIKIIKTKKASQNIKEQAIIALGKLENHQAMHFLLIYLYNKKTNTILATIKALGLLKDKRAIPHLEKRYERLKSIKEKIFVILSLALIQNIKDKFINKLILIANEQKKTNSDFVKDFLNSINTKKKKEKLINYILSHKLIKKENKKIITKLLNPNNHNNDKNYKKKKENKNYSDN